MISIVNVVKNILGTIRNNPRHFGNKNGAINPNGSSNIKLPVSWYQLRATLSALNSDKWTNEY